MLSTRLRRGWKVAVSPTDEHLWSESGIMVPFGVGYICCGSYPNKIGLESGTKMGTEPNRTVLDVETGAFVIVTNFAALMSDAVAHTLDGCEVQPLGEELDLEREELLVDMDVVRERGLDLINTTAYIAITGRSNDRRLLKPFLRSHRKGIHFGALVDFGSCITRQSEMSISFEVVLNSDGVFTYMTKI